MGEFNPLEFGEFRGTVTESLANIKQDINGLGEGQRRLSDRLTAIESNQQRGNGWRGTAKTGGIGMGGAGFMLGLWKIIESML